MTLQELTGQESGVVVYHETGEAIACNWVGIEGLPRVFAGAIVGLGEMPEVIDRFQSEAAAVASRLEAVRIIYSEAPAGELPPGQSIVYKLGTAATVIAPLDWN